MPIFSLTDIKFNAPKGPTGPLSPLGINTKFDSKTYKYPIDLGSTDKNHYMMINILEQRKTTFENPGSGKSGFSTANTNAKAYGSIGGNQLVNDFGKFTEDIKDLAVTLVTDIGGAIGLNMPRIYKAIDGGMSDKYSAADGAERALVELVPQTLKDLATGSVRATTRI